MDEGPSFEDGVTAIMMVAEELKQSLNDDIQEGVVEWQAELDGVAQRLHFLLRLTLDAPGDEMREDLFRHCAKRAVDVSLQVLKHVTNNATGEVPDVDQAAVARIAELGLNIHGMSIEQQSKNKEEHDEITKVIVELYTSYQRQLLRQRSKPAIHQLAQWRSNKNRNLVVEEEEAQQQPHTHAVTVILGQGSALLHPLLLWKQQVPPDTPVATMCQSAIAMLDEQAQTLTKTVCDWFHTDRKVEDWMGRTALTEPQQLDLAELDALCEEMGFCCQILARYELLIQQVESPVTIISKELLPEWTWRYAALERFLSTQQWQHALQMASPVDIVMGTPIKVPSVVEDAQYLSTRALERAASTRSVQAMGTVAHSVSRDVWSTDNVSGGVYEALVQQRGCWADPKEGETKDTKSPPASANTNSGNNTFASALLDALDDDLGAKKTTGTPKAAKKPPSAPSSGGILGGLVSLAGGQQELQQFRLDTQLCNLNGIHSATVACSSLVQLLENLLEDSNSDQGEKDSKSTNTSMIELAREELLRYHKAYQEFLNHKTNQVLLEWCAAPTRKDMCLLELNDFFSREVYKLDATAFRHAESDSRLQQEMMLPLARCPIVQNLEKCDAEVTTLLCRDLSGMVANLVLKSLWEETQPQRQFTDWGSLLLSTQIRMLTRFMCHLVEKSSEDTSYNTAPVMDPWEKVTEVVTVLQLEKPSDFTAYQATCSLSPQELQQTLSLRVDFSSDAIQSTTQAYANSKQQHGSEK